MVLSACISGLCDTLKTILKRFWGPTMQTIKTLAALTVASAASSLALADVGVLDKYECHKHSETNKYHCHGPADLAKMGGVIIGADARVQTWMLDSGDPFLFAGAAVNVEYNYNWFAVTGSYFFMPLVTDVSDNNVAVDDSVYLQGWEAGVKVGPGVGRLGTKFYATAGWSNPDLTDTGDSSNDATLPGYYVGAGFGANTNTLVFDVVATYRDATEVEAFLVDQGNDDPSVTNFDVRVGAGWRF